MTKAEARVRYEVVITVEPEIRDEYLNWLRHHMAQMLKHDGFVGAALFTDGDAPDSFTCHYDLVDMDAMNAYLAGPAKAMRADGVARFGERFRAVRRILAGL